MEIATIKRGESFTFKVVLNAEYDMARLKEYYLYIGGRAMTGTVNGNAITVKLRSEDTDLMSGINKITLWLDDTILGVQKPYLGDMVVSMTNADESNTSVSEVDNALIPVTITATAITVGDILYNYVKGMSAYQVWLDAGNEGSYTDYEAWLRKPATDIAEIVNTAEILRQQNEVKRQQNINIIIQNAEIAIDAALEAASSANSIADSKIDKSSIVYITQIEYEMLADNGQLLLDVEYNIYEE